MHRCQAADGEDCAGSYALSSQLRVRFFPAGDAGRRTLQTLLLGQRAHTGFLQWVHLREASVLEEEKGSCSFCSPQDAGLHSLGLLPQPRRAPTASGCSHSLGSPAATPRSGHLRSALTPAPAASPEAAPPGGATSPIVQCFLFAFFSCSVNTPIVL